MLRWARPQAETCMPAKDGNVYRNTGNGWQKYDNGNWNTATSPYSASAQPRTQNSQQKSPTTARNRHSTECPEFSAALAKQSGNFSHGSNPAAGAEFPAKESHERANRHSTQCPELSAAPAKQSGSSCHSPNPAAAAGLRASKQRDDTRCWTAATRADQPAAAPKNL